MLAPGTFTRLPPAGSTTVLDGVGTDDGDPEVLDDVLAEGSADGSGSSDEDPQPPASSATTTALATMGEHRRVPREIMVRA